MNKDKDAITKIAVLAELTILGIDDFKKALLFVTCISKIPK